MAHTKSSDPASKLTREINRGYRSRRIKEVPILWAADRTAQDADSSPVADVIDSETIQKAIMIAPCKGKILRVYTNALAYPTSAGATKTVTVKKAVIGGADVGFLSAVLGVEAAAQTAVTACDGTLSTSAGALEFDEGQLIYAEAASDATATTAKSNGFVVGIEWVPTER